ncbi:MAG: universal stress protein, partial [Anaerolineales bacterium]|nr:universal stress protein [Anaerolineales bacterium]
GIDYTLEKQVAHASSPVEGILEAATDADMLIIGATKERFFINLLIGNVSQRIADEAHCPVLIVKRRSTVLKSMLRETVLQPVLRSPKLKSEE